MSKQIRVTIYDGEPFAVGKGWPPNNSREFIKWFADRILEAPAECRNDVSIELGSRHDYGDTEVTLEIYYWRDKTQDEIEAEILAANRQNAEHVTKELIELSRLKAKYEKD